MKRVGLPVKKGIHGKEAPERQVLRDRGRGELVQKSKRALGGLGKVLSDSSVILFPHTHLTAPKLKEVLAHFGRLTICQPWFMDEPVRSAERDGSSLIDVVNPPVDLKPKGHFKRLLSEYRLWIRQNQDRGYSAPLSARQIMTLSEELPWGIRQMIRQMGDHSSPPLKDHTLKWHLILHLAQESEENRVRAEEMLLQMKQEKSPLAEALGEESPGRGLFEDLTAYDTSPYLNMRYFRQVFEAWLGLFGNYVPHNGWLVTLDRHVMNYAREIFQDRIATFHAEGEEPSFVERTLGPAHSTPEYVQLPPDDGIAHTDPILARLSGKRIILLAPL
jgi:hypothetical protein